MMLGVAHSPMTSGEVQMLLSQQDADSPAMGGGLGSPVGGDDIGLLPRFGQGFSPSGADDLMAFVTYNDDGVTGPGFDASTFVDGGSGMDGMSIDMLVSPPPASRLDDMEAAASGGSANTSMATEDDDGDDDDDEEEEDDDDDDDDEGGGNGAEGGGGCGAKVSTSGRGRGAVDSNLLCQQYKLCNEPRVPKSRGKGLHPYCAKHKEVRQQAWRRAAKKYREKKRIELYHQVVYQGIDDEESYYTGETVVGGGSSTMMAADDVMIAATTMQAEPSGGRRHKRRVTSSPSSLSSSITAYSAATASTNSSTTTTTATGPQHIVLSGSSNSGSSSSQQQKGYHHHHPSHTEQVNSTTATMAEQPSCSSSSASSSSTNTTSSMPWPQLWFQKDMMAFVNPTIRQEIKRDFDNFTQGRPGFKGYTVQDSNSIEINASPSHHRKNIAAIMGKRVYPIERLTWFDPFLDFLAEQWWDTALAMFLEQIEKDENRDERQRAERVLCHATTTTRRKHVLTSLLSSMTLLTYSQEQEEVLLGPKHGHMVMVINIHGDGNLVFRLKDGAGGGGGGGGGQQPQKVVTFPLRAGDVYCYTGDYRYEATNKVAMQCDYRCAMTLRFYLPGREALVRMRSGDESSPYFLGWRKLDKKDKDDDNMWGPIPGKRGSVVYPSLKTITAVTKASEQQEQAGGGGGGVGETAEQRVVNRTLANGSVMVMETGRAQAAMMLLPTMMQHQQHQHAVLSPSLSPPPPLLPPLLLSPITGPSQHLLGGAGGEDEDDDEQSRRITQAAVALMTGDMMGSDDDFLSHHQMMMMGGGGSHEALASHENMLTSGVGGGL